MPPPLDLEHLDKMVEEGYVSKGEHPDGGLYIYNYTPKTQYEPNWNKSTLLARGLILDTNGAIVARPFPKFFTLEQHSSSDIVFHKPFTVFDKMDGSLGILYRNPSGDLAIATRGSFMSDQAKWATEFFHNQPLYGAYGRVLLDDNATYLFEIIYPQNRIVVNYHGFEGLVMLGAVDKQTGRDLDYFDPPYPYPWPVVKHYGSLDCKPSEVIAKLNPVDDGDTEGYVLRFDWPLEGPQTRIKVKMEEYCRLHRILTQVSSKSIWECLKAGNNEMKDLMDRVPDEFYNWVKITKRSLQIQHQNIWWEVRDQYVHIVDRMAIEEREPDLDHEWITKNSGRRKRFAELAQEAEYTGFMFALLDQKEAMVKDKIWDMVKPQFEKAFKTDDDS